MRKSTVKEKRNLIKLDFLPEEEKEEFSTLGNLKSGKYFAIEARWFNLWIEYINGGQHPGPIKTQGLLNSSGFRRDLRYPKDYKVLNLQQWIFLYSIYSSEAPIELVNPFELNIVPASSSVAHYLSTPVTERMGLDTLTSLQSCLFTENTIEIPQHPEIFQKNVGFIQSLDNYSVYFCVLNTLIAQNTMKKLISFYFKGIFTVICRVLEKMSKEKFSIVHSSLIDQFVIEHLNSDKNDPWVQVLNKFDSESETLDFSSAAGIVVNNEISCQKCCVIKNELQKVFYLDIDVHRKLQDSLMHFGEAQKSDTECEQCGGIMVNKSEIIDSSEIVCLKINRFRTIPYLYKIFGKVKYRKNIRFCNKDYTLLAVITHEGPAENNCYSLTCKRGKSWYNYSNTGLTKLTLSEALNKIALYLIYNHL